MGEGTGWEGGREGREDVDGSNLKGRKSGKSNVFGPEERRKFVWGTEWLKNWEKRL
jgi:hypothetical protein